MTFTGCPIVAQSYLGISGYSEIGSQNMILDSKFRIFGSILRSDRTKKLETPLFRDHPTFRVMRQSCSAYSLSLKYLSSLKPYALRFITFILLFIPSTLAVEI